MGCADEVIHHICSSVMLGERRCGDGFLLGARQDGVRMTEIVCEEYDGPS